MKSESAPHPAPESRPFANDHEDVILVVDEERRYDMSFFRKLMLHTGPGFLMCIAYIDPGNLEADLQTGSSTGYALLWVLLWSTVMGLLLQSCSSRLGVATGKHLAQLCRIHYSPVLRMLLWIMAELAIIGSDIQEVIGTALALSILTNGWLPLWMGVIAAAISAYFMLFMEKFGVYWLERFFQAAVAIMAVCMATVFFMADVPYGAVAKGLVVPSLPVHSLPVAAGLLGSIIMPHNLYLHSALVHSRPVGQLGGLPNLQESILFYNIEAALALAVTLVINIAVIGVFAKGFYGHGGDIGLQNAGKYLGKRFGKHVELIWAVGLLSSGQSSTITGTFAGQHVMSGFFEFKINPLSRALLTRAVALFPTLIVALTTRNNPTRLDTLNQALNVLQSVQLPFVIVPLLALTSAPGIMGIGFASSSMQSTVNWLIAAVIVAINLGTVYQAAEQNLPEQLSILHLLFFSIIFAYVALVAYIIIVSSRLRFYVPHQGDVEHHRAEEADEVTDPLLGSSDPGSSSSRSLSRPVSPAEEAKTGVTSYAVGDVSTPP